MSKPSYSDVVAERDALREEITVLKSARPGPGNIEPCGDCERLRCRVEELEAANAALSAAAPVSVLSASPAASSDVPSFTVPHDAPPCPPRDPLAGDKTPAVVEWFRQYAPEEFARRYAGRKLY